MWDRRGGGQIGGAIGRVCLSGFTEKNIPEGFSLLPIANGASLQGGKVCETHEAQAR